MKTCTYLLALVLGASGAAFADDSQPVHIEDVTIRGLSGTDQDVILDLLDVMPGERVSRQQIDQGVQRIKNTRLFTEVEHKLVANAGSYDVNPPSKTLEIHAKDRWTTIPIFKFSSGGGVNQLVLGLYDPNVAGKLWEMGGQIERLEETNSGVIWAKKPRFLSLPLTLDLQVWSINRLRSIYDQDAEALTLEDGYLQERQKIMLGGTWEFSDDLRLGVSLTQNRDGYSRDIVPEGLALTTQTEVGLPEEITGNLAAVTLGLGSLKYEEYLVTGASLEYTVTGGQIQAEAGADSESIQQQDLTLLGAHNVDENFSLVGRAAFGVSNGAHPEYRYYLGGLDRIRGYTDNRFRSDRYGLLNAEVRSVVWDYRPVVTQVVGFYDALTLGDDGRKLGSLDASSVGAGLRIIVPKIYRFVARLDYAYTLQKDDPQSLSFGFQQFF